jgi:tetratricopeptide (TPR) repeat protein
LNESVRYYTAARALRPDNPGVHFNLGLVLYRQKDLEGAVKAYKKAIHLAPRYAVAHYNLGVALQNKNDPQGAARAYRKAIEIDPNHADAYHNLGNALGASGDGEGAVKALLKATELAPKDAQSHYNLGLALHRQKDLEGALTAFRKAVALDPNNAQAQGNVGAALFEKGDLEGAVQAFRQAVAIDPDYAQAHGGLGQALLNQGQFAQAEAATRRALDLFPPGSPLHRITSGQLRRCQALRALDEKLALVQQGKATPAGAAERLGLAWLAQQPYKGLPALSARLYAEAFTKQPAAAHDPRSQRRYNAACAAALAAAGKGKDAAGLDARERARLRRQALGWLEADLAAWAKQADQASSARAAARQALSHWLADPDLAGVRGPAALERLPEPERARWARLWDGVALTLKQTSRGGDSGAGE